MQLPDCMDYLWSNPKCKNTFDWVQYCFSTKSAHHNLSAMTRRLDKDTRKPALDT